MKQTNEVEKMDLFKISKHEKEILCRLNDLMLRTYPNFFRADGNEVVCNCGSKDNPVDFLWGSYTEVKNAFKFIFKQILINHNLSRLSDCVDELEEHSISDILFGETLDGEFYMSLGRD